MISLIISLLIFVQIWLQVFLFWFHFLDFVRLDFLDRISRIVISYFSGFVFFFFACPPAL